MLALKIIGGIFGAVAAVVVGMFVYFFMQSFNEIRNCQLLPPNALNHPYQRAYQCADGIHYQPHQ